MSEVGVRELRNNTASLIERVRGGEAVIITVHGRPVARLEPVRSTRPASITRAELVTLLDRSSADPGMRDDLAALSGDTTDDLGDL